VATNHGKSDFFLKEHKVGWNREENRPDKKRISFFIGAIFM